MQNEVPKDEAREQALRLSLALCEMRDSLVRLSLALKDSLFEAHLSQQAGNSDEQNANAIHTQKDSNPNDF